MARERFKFTESIDFATTMDVKDPLGSYRGQFMVADEDMIYLDGNSLGRLPVKTREKMEYAVDFEWGTRLIRSWNEGWYTLAQETAKPLAKIIGCKEDEVVITDSTSLNLYKLAYAALKLKEGGRKVVSDEFNFPTDLYVIQGIIEQLGEDYRLELIPSADGIHISSDDVRNTINEETALVVLSLVSYKSAFLYDMAEVTSIAREKGALVIWDLSHAAGAVPVELNKCEADMAIGCTYKYLNGGPGSPAYLYVRRELQEKLTSPVWGWFGDADPFAFNQEYKPAPGIRKFLVGTPPVLSLSAIKTGLNTTLCAGMKQIREKSIWQTEYLAYLTRQLLLPLGFSIGSPEDPEQRGSHLSLRHPEAYRISQAMIRSEELNYRVIPDFREPDHIRLGINPLYNTFRELYLAVKVIKEILEKRIYQRYSDKKTGVT